MVSKNLRKKNILHRRYAHSSVYLNGHVYIIGGYDHKDHEKATPNTLNSCEKFWPGENKWSYVGNINQARAHMGVCVIADQYIYIFGGMHDYATLQTIEKYDSVVDNWNTVYCKMVMPLSRCGVVSLDNKKSIILIGGMTADDALSRGTFKLDLTTSKWTTLADMKISKTFCGGSLYAYDSYIYAIGGNDSHVCERFDANSSQWEILDSYTDISDVNDIGGWCFVMS